MKTQIHIIGGGPIGLFCAIKASKAGMDVTVYDARFGVYTRPGTLAHPTMKKIYDAIDPSYVFMDEKMREFSRKSHADGMPPPHIKDAERLLYHYAKEEVKANPVKFVQKQFVNFSKDQKSFTVADESSEEVINCSDSFIVDCSGSARVVVHKINETTPGTFLIAKNESPPYPHHFIAYVTVDSQEVIAALEEMTYRGIVEDDDDDDDDDFKPNLIFFQGLTEMKEKFQWNEIRSPCLFATFPNAKKLKVCFYGECPKSLDKNQLKEWVELLIKTTTFGKVSTVVHEIPRDGAKVKKPRFGKFTVGDQYLQNSFYNGVNFKVVALGDAQIDPYFATGLGIASGIERVSLFFRCATIVAGKVLEFNEKKFTVVTKKIIDKLKSRFTRKTEDTLKSTKTELNELLESGTSSIVAQLNEINLKLPTTIDETFELSVSDIFSGMIETLSWLIVVCKIIGNDDGEKSLSHACALLSNVVDRAINSEKIPSNSMLFKLFSIKSESLNCILKEVISTLQTYLKPTASGPDLK